MTGAIVRIRVSEQSKDAAYAAAQSGELVELRDRRGTVHKGWVRSIPEWEFSVDSGWWAYFEHQADFTTQDVIAKLLQLREGK